jgi:3',5'-cyclic AMP phosphodiesterase CpdA
LLDGVPLPWFAIPGNHDVGDVGDIAQPITTERRQRYADVFGDASWSVERGGWRLVGVDVQTLQGDGAAAGSLKEWLDGELGGAILPVA